MDVWKVISVLRAPCAASVSSKRKKKPPQRRRRRNDATGGHYSDIDLVTVSAGTDLRSDPGQPDTACGGRQARPEWILAGPEHRGLGSRIPGWRTRAARGTHAGRTHGHSAGTGRGRGRKDPVSTMGVGQAE